MKKTCQTMAALLMLMTLGIVNAKEEVKTEPTNKVFMYLPERIIDAGDLFGNRDNEDLGPAFADFLAGFLLFDPSKDSDYTEVYTEKFEGEDVVRSRSLWGADQIARDYDSILGTTPLHRLGRGLSNVVFGIWEIPQNIIDVNKDQGPGAAVTYGLVRGISRFAMREGAGVTEIFTFPRGGRPEISPEYPWMPHEDNSWKYHYND